MGLSHEHVRQPLDLFLIRIRRLLVRQSEKVIYADMIKPRQRNQNLRREHAFSAFVISIGSLRNIDLPAQLRLCKVRVLSQIADSLVSFSHFYHHGHYSPERFVLLTF